MAGSAWLMTQTSPQLQQQSTETAENVSRVEYLSKFSPSPSSPSASFAGALVERMAGRVLVFFVRHASLLRPLSQAGKVQLAKVDPRTAGTAEMMWPACCIICGCGLARSHEHG